MGLVGHRGPQNVSTAAFIELSALGRLIFTAFLQERVLLVFYFMEEEMQCPREMMKFVQSHSTG